MANVILYSTPTCEWCKKTRQYFANHAISYVDINVNDDDFQIEQMVSKSGQSGVPVIDIDGHIIIGFNKAKLDELLKI